MTTQNSQINAADFIVKFFQRAAEDPVIGPSHIALYLAILKEWISSGNPCCVRLYYNSLMKRAKIGSTSTFSKLLRDLREGNYVHFEPSYNHSQPSKFQILAFPQKVEIE